MLSKRSTFYWLWFLTFGLTATVACLVNHTQLSSENIWLFAISLLGILSCTKDLQGSFGRPFDFFVGVFFTTVGLIGILHAFGMGLYGFDTFVGSFINDSWIFGLSLAFIFALIHVVFGFIALAYALKSPSSQAELVTSSKE